MRLTVECQPDGQGEPEPIAIDFDGRSVRVLSIDDRWPAPTHRYFRVIGSDGGIYILRHDTQSGEWTLGGYRAADAGGNASV